MVAKIGGERRRALRTLVGCGAALLASACDAMPAPPDARVQTRVVVQLPGGETRGFFLGRVVPPRGTAEHTALAEKCLSESGIERASVRITEVYSEGPLHNRTLRVHFDPVSGAVAWWGRGTSLSCGMDGSLEEGRPYRPLEPVTPSLIPSVSLADAARTAMPSLRRRCDFWNARKTGYVVELMIVDAPILHTELLPRLAWVIGVSPGCGTAPTFVDAQSGNLLFVDNSGKLRGSVPDSAAGARTPGDHAPASPIQVGSVSALQVADEAFWNHRAVFFPSTSIGYAAGRGGYVAKTVDGGGTWTTLEAGIEGARRIDPTTGWVTRLFFHDAKEGYATAADDFRSLLAHTVDGGETWTTLETPASWGSLLDVAFWDRQRGVVVGSRGMLATTRDGGATWQEHRAGPPGHRSVLGHVVLTGPSSAVVPEGGQLLRTEDGGTTWTEVAVSGRDDDPLSVIAFGSAQVGYAAGMGRMWKTVDGGKTWSSLSSVPSRIQAMAFRDELRGVAVGVGMEQGGCGGSIQTDIHVTEDGGRTWQSVPVDVGPHYLADVHFPAPDKGFAVGTTGIVSLTWTR